MSPDSDSEVVVELFELSVGDHRFSAPSFDEPTADSQEARYEIDVRGWLDPFSAAADWIDRVVDQAIAGLEGALWRFAPGWTEVSSVPRTSDHVRRLVWAPAESVVETWGDSIEVRDGRRPLLTAVAPEFVPAPDGWGVVVPCRLMMPVTRRRLAVWLSVEPWWHERAAITIRMRSRRRWRYPKRYFDAAHEALEELIERSGARLPPTPGNANV